MKKTKHGNRLFLNNIQNSFHLELWLLLLRCYENGVDMSSYGRVGF